MLKVLLLSLARHYAGARGLSLSRVSTLVFSDGKVLARLSSGGDITTGRFEGAMHWFGSNWPDGCDWPSDIPRHFEYFISPASSSAGDAGASLPPSDAPASLSQDRAAVAQLVHTQQVAGSNPAPATSFQSPDILPSGVRAGARRKDDAGRAPASSVLGSAV